MITFKTDGNSCQKSKNDNHSDIFKFFFYRFDITSQLLRFTPDIFLKIELSFFLFLTSVK